MKVHVVAKRSLAREDGSRNQRHRNGKFKVSRASSSDCRQFLGETGTALSGIADSWTGRRLSEGRGDVGIGRADQCFRGEDPVRGPGKPEEGAMDPKMAAPVERRDLPRYRGNARYGCWHGQTGTGGLLPAWPGVVLPPHHKPKAHPPSDGFAGVCMVGNQGKVAEVIKIILLK